MEITLVEIGECKRCKRGVLDKKQWLSLPFDIRKSLKPAYTGGPMARGICNSCYSSLYLHSPDDLIDFERKTVPLAIFAEEYKMMHDSGMTDNHIAEKLDMVNKTEKSWPSARLNTFYTALKRAKKAGLL
jgi:hypothetical protein